jgi:hypothetical protein
MAQGGVSQSIAAQAEWLRPELENLTLSSSVLWKRLTVRSDIKPVSNRPARIPFQVQTGGRPKVASFDGSSLGRGSAPNEAPGSLSCVSFLLASEYTALAEWSTDSNEKAIQNFVTLTHEQAAANFGGFLDALVCRGDGSNTIDTVVSTVTGGIVVNNADAFLDQQYVAITHAIGTAPFTTVQIQSIDIANNTIWLTSAVPAGVTGGDVILAEDSTGQANSGLFGLDAYLLSGNVGNYMGISRAAYPGKFSTPTIDLGGMALTPAIVRALQMQQILALGIDNDGKSNIAHCNVDVAAAWENNALNVQSIIRNQVKGQESTDMLGNQYATTIAGRTVLMNVRAQFGILDLLDLSTWFLIQVRANDLYEVGGQTIFPAYGNDGGIASAMMFYLCVVVQTGCGQPRKQARLSNIAIPPNIVA